MIQIKDYIDLEYVYMGLFEGGPEWTHPKVTTQTYEIIYVLKGCVYITEGGCDYAVKEGNLIILEPDVEHNGYKKSGEDVSFYWTHFESADFKKHCSQKVYECDDQSGVLLFFRQLSHLTNEEKNKAIIETKLLLFLLELEHKTLSYNKLCADISEWIRIYSEKPLTVGSVSKRFGYHPDYISKLFKKYYLMTLKEYIDSQKIIVIKNLLLSSELTVFQIADACGFSDANYLTKFFKKHEKITPSEFRSKYWFVHKNIK